MDKKNDNLSHVGDDTHIAKEIFKRAIGPGAMARLRSIKVETESDCEKLIDALYSELGRPSGERPPVSSSWAERFFRYFADRIEVFKAVAVAACILVFLGVLAFLAFSHRHAVWKTLFEGGASAGLTACSSDSSHGEEPTEFHIGILKGEPAKAIASGIGDSQGTPSADARLLERLLGAGMEKLSKRLEQIASEGNLAGTFSYEQTRSEDRLVLQIRYNGNPLGRMSIMYETTESSGLTCNDVYWAYDRTVGEEMKGDFSAILASTLAKDFRFDEENQ